MENHDFLMTTLFPYINFIIFFIVLVYIAKKPITAMFAGRRAQFLNSSDEADREKKAALKYKQDLEKIAENLDQELDKIVVQAKENATQRSKEMLEQANKLSAHIVAESKRVAEAELSEAIKLLRTELVVALQDSVKNKIQKDFAPEQQANLIETRVDMIH